VRGHVCAAGWRSRSRQSYLGCADRQVATSIQVDISRAGAWDPRDPRVETIWDICGATAALLGYKRELAVSSRTGSHHRALPSQVAMSNSIGRRELELIPQFRDPRIRGSVARAAGTP
jgi:hypothetical protein